MESYLKISNAVCYTEGINLCTVFDTGILTLVNGFYVGMKLDTTYDINVCIFNV